MRRNIFLASWLLATIVLAWQVAHGQRQFDAGGVAGTLVILLCAATFTWWLPGPQAPPSTGAERTSRGRFLLLSALSVVGLLALRDLIGPPLLFGFPVAAVLALILLREPVVRCEALYAVFLAVVASIAALELGRARFSPVVWAGLQLALVVPCLLAGWGLLRKAGLFEAGLGHSLFVDSGWRPAVIGAGQGLVLGLPWALYNVALGGSNGDAWVQEWWHPLSALQPGIGEEAWGRVFLIPLLFLILRRAATARTALAAAVLIAAFWFAYLHTPGGLSLSSLFSALLIGAVYAVPLSILWLRRGLEPAMGFHVWQDFFRFGFALLLNLGLQ